MTIAGPVDDGSHTEYPEHEAIEAGMSLLARKLRAEMILALFEEFTKGKITGYFLLLRFAEVQEQFRADQDDAGNKPGDPEWERLRRQAHARNRPIVLWEIFHALDQLAKKSQAGLLPDNDFTVAVLEKEVNESNVLGRPWSLHEEVRTARAKLGRDFKPSDPVDLAFMLLRIHIARTLLKEGDIQVGFRPGSNAEAPEEVLSERMVAFMQDAMGRTAKSDVTQQSAIAVVGNGANTPALKTDLERALRAGESRNLAERARKVAHTARARATELRAKRMEITKIAFAAGATYTAAVIHQAHGVPESTRDSSILTAAGAILVALREWNDITSPLRAHFRAFGAEKVATMSERMADRDAQVLDQGMPVSRLRDASYAFRRGLASRAVQHLDRTSTPPDDTTRGASRDQRGTDHGQSM